MRIERKAVVFGVWLICLFWAGDVFAFYNPSTGRWLSRDPIGEKGGLNVYAFVRNGISSIDARGLKVCEKCEVKNINLQFVGIVFDSSSYLLHLIGDVSFKTKHNDGSKYNSGCCKVVQYQKSRATVNGKTVNTATSGGPVDENWHVDALDWTKEKDDSATSANGLSGTDVRFDSDGEIEWMQDAEDDPGQSSLNEGDTFDRTSSFQWKVYDLCSDPAKPKLVATSRTITMHVRSTSGWPEVDYSYTR